MSKQMTPCEKLGYKIGDKFEMVVSDYGWIAGDVVKLVRDDGTVSPEFEGVTTKNRRYDDNKMFLYIEGEKTCVKLIPAKLKPAKQAMDDAIHQNGGWRGGKYAVYGKQSGKCSFLTCKPQYIAKDHGWLARLSWIVCEFEMKPFINWHQTILSRDEYFTAYPEQVKVDIKNEAEQKFEAEMKSESEMTIKASDWHKNGELPPVGEFVDVVGDDLMYGQGERNREVIAHVENTAVIRMGYGLGCFASHALAPAKSERDWVIGEMVDCLGSRWANCEEIAAHLYENGYRKEVK